MLKGKLQLFTPWNDVDEQRYHRLWNRTSPTITEASYNDRHAAIMQLLFAYLPRTKDNHKQTKMIVELADELTSLTIGDS